MSGGEDGTYYFSTFIFEFETEEEAFTQSDNIVVTYKLYPAGDDSSPLTIRRTITSEYYDEDHIITRASHTITQDGDSFLIKELKSEEILQNGYDAPN